jgi:acyl-CoA thioester hydrolase
MRPSRLSRDAFRHFQPISTRWSDNDVFGHVNNVVYYSWFDTAVTGWLIGRGLLDPVGSPVIPVVAATNCAYFRSISFPEAVDVGIGAERVGISSVTYRVAIFAQDEALAAAQGLFTHVYVTRNSQTPAGIPAEVRAALGELVDEVSSSGGSSRCGPRWP